MNASGQPDDLRPILVDKTLRVGEAVVDVTPKPHNGCKKFAGRFGEDALRFVQAAATRHHNLRGIYWRVVLAGEAGVGRTDPRALPARGR